MDRRRSAALGSAQSAVQSVFQLRGRAPSLLSIISLPDGHPPMFFPFPHPVLPYRLCPHLYVVMCECRGVGTVPPGGLPERLSSTASSDGSSEGKRRLLTAQVVGLSWQSASSLLPPPTAPPRASPSSSPSGPVPSASTTPRVVLRM